MENIFDEINKNRLKEQDFTLAIIWGFLYIFLIYARNFCDSAPKILAGIAGIFFWIIFQQCFKIYLKNFSSESAIKWINLKIVTNNLMLALLIAITLLPGKKSIVYYFGVSNGNIKMVISFAYWAGIFIDLILAILFGIELSKIKNDFIGLLKKTGTIFIYVTPFFHLIYLVVLFTKPLREIYNSGNNPFFATIIDSLAMIPAFFIIKIFILAYRYRKAYNIRNKYS